MLRFTKGHGLGNDFLILEGSGRDKLLSVADVRAICDRRRGVGADGILIREEGHRGLPFMRIFNADGSQPEMCGNGVRVFALYLVQRLGFDPSSLELDTPAGVRVVDVDSIAEEGRGQVRVDMGCASGPKDCLNLDFQGAMGPETAEGFVVSMGNPHFVLTGDAFSATQEIAISVGPLLEFHENFPDGTNVEFVERIGEDALRVFVWERGCGLTQACGTGACAAVVVSARQGLVDFDRDITVTLPGGDLLIRVEAETERVWMTGPAALVAEVAYGL